MFFRKLCPVAAAIALFISVVGASLVYSGGDKKDAAPGAKKDAADEKTIRALVADLSDESFEKREGCLKCTGGHWRAGRCRSSRKSPPRPRMR